MANLKIDEQTLELLINELLEDLKADTQEASENVAFYKKELIVDFGIERVGQIYNDALKIKGSTRDRMLKAIVLIRDRLKAKEMANKDGKTKEWTAEELSELKREISDQNE